MGTAAELKELVERAPDQTVAAARRVLEVGRDPVRGAALVRVVNALLALVKEVPSHRIAEVLSESSDTSVLLKVLEQPDVVRAVVEALPDDPLVAARLRGLAMRQQIVETEGGVWPLEGVCRHLRLSRQGVHRRRQAGQLLALHVGRRGYLYPAWQFTARGTLPGLEEVLAALKGLAAWTQATFLLSANSALDDRRPLDLLRRGHIEPVVRAARMYGEQGAI